MKQEHIIRKVEDPGMKSPYSNVTVDHDNDVENRVLETHIKRKIRNAQWLFTSLHVS
jgi:hypothetical protein